jgi:hypothetical protein
MPKAIEPKKRAAKRPAMTEEQRSKRLQQIMLIMLSVILIFSMIFTLFAK